MLSILVDIPPTVNHLYYDVPYKNRKTGKYHCRRRLSDEGKNYKETVGWTIKGQAQEDGWEYKSGDRIHITLDLTFGDNRRRDITNCIKVIEDAVSEALAFDDRVVDEFFVRRVGIEKGNPYAWVSIDKIGGKQ